MITKQFQHNRINICRDAMLGVSTLRTVDHISLITNKHKHTKGRKMEWSEPGFVFRVSFKKINVMNERFILDKESGYEQLRTIMNDYEQLDETEKRFYSIC